MSPTDQAVPTTITVIGLGAMGLPMATNLATRFSVRGVDIAEDRLELGRSAGLSVYTSATEAVAGADVVLLAVRDQAQLTEVLFGTTGIVEHMSPGSAIILTSTVGMGAVEAVAPALSEAGIRLIDAPISGGPARAGAGDLLVTVGATQEDFDHLAPVLETMSSTLVHVGNAPGKGQALKTVNQLLCGIHIAAGAEALALADRLGLDQKTALDALMAGAAASFMLGDRGPRMLEAYDEPGAEVKSRLDIFVKDMGIVTDAAHAAGMPVPIAAAAEQTYAAGLVRGWGADDDSSIIRVNAPTRAEHAS